MFVVTNEVLNDTFAEINRVLFFSQLSMPAATVIENLDSEYSYCYREDGDVDIYMGVTDRFVNEGQFRWVMLYEMIRLFQYQVEDNEPSYTAPSFYMYEKHGFKKLHTLEDPNALEDREEE